MNTEAFIEWREKHKETIRAILMFICALGIVWEVISLQTYTQEISSPEFNVEQYIPSEFKNNQSLEHILTTIQDPNYYLDQNKIVEIPYNPISKAVWSLVNLSFYLFVLSLLWRSQE